MGWIWDEVKNEKDLTVKAKKEMRTKWTNRYRRKNRKAFTNKKFNRIARKVIVEKDIKEIIYSVLSFNEFVKRIENIVVGIYSGEHLEVAAVKQKTVEKDSLKCLLYEELQAIKIAERITKEMEKRLIFLNVAVITENGNFKIHPLLEEIIKEQNLFIKDNS